MSYKIELSEECIEKIKHVVSQNYAILSQTEIKTDKGKCLAWAPCCAILDRLMDLIHYLNKTELNTGEFTDPAFDFYNFITQSDLLLHSIQALCMCLSIDYNELVKDSDFFKERLPRTTDDGHFSYLRSIFFIHSYYNKFGKETKVFESCPFVKWADEPHTKDRELVATIYDLDKPEVKIKYISIHQLFGFITHRVSLLKTIFDKFCRLVEEKRKLIRNSQIRSKYETESLIDYLQYLREETKKRIGEDNHHAEHIIAILSVKCSKECNAKLLQEYQQKLIEAVTDLPSIIQKLPLENGELQSMDSYENAPLIEYLVYPECYCNSLPLDHHTLEPLKHGGDRLQIEFARESVLKNESVNKYFSLTGEEPDSELWALGYALAYLHMNENCDYFKNN